MNEKKWGVTLIVTSVLLVVAISLLYFTLKSPDMPQGAQWAVRIFAIAACAAQFIVIVLFAKSFKSSKRNWPDQSADVRSDVRGKPRK